METTPPTITEAQAITKEDPPAPPPAVTVTVQLEEQHPAEDLYECCLLLNHKRMFRRQRLANRQQEQQGDNYDYSNCDLRHVINVGRDARNIINSRRKERGKSRRTALLPTTASRQKLPHPSRSTSRQPQVPVLRVNHAPRTRMNHLKVATGSTKYCYASALSTQRALTRSSSVTHSARPLGHLP